MTRSALQRPSKRAVSATAKSAAAATAAALGKSESDPNKSDSTSASATVSPYFADASMEAGNGDGSRRHSTRVAAGSTASSATTPGSLATRFAYRPEAAAPDIEDAVPDVLVGDTVGRRRSGRTATTGAKRLRREESQTSELVVSGGRKTVKEEQEDEEDDDDNMSSELSRPPESDAESDGYDGATTGPTRRRKRAANGARVGAVGGRKSSRSAASSALQSDANGNGTTDDTGVRPPPNWERIYELLRKMRSPGGAAYPAAVDTMGCERLADVHESPRNRRFQTLVALMLSSQTKDTVNAVAMARLKAELPPWRPGEPPGLNLENILAVQESKLNEMIEKVGFHNLKAKYIKQAAVILQTQHGSDIPSTFAGLVALPGVGPKMAHLCMSAAWGRTEGIGVDVHVHRIANLWRWVGAGRGGKPTKNPEETRVALEAWLPRDRWREINGLLVGFGQTVCLPVGRRCGECEIGLQGLCPAADRAKVNEGRRRRGMVRGEDGQWVVQGESKGDGLGKAEDGAVEGVTESVEHTVVKVKTEDGTVTEEKESVAREVTVTRNGRAKRSR